MIGRSIRFFQSLAAIFADCQEPLGKAGAPPISHPLQALPQCLGYGFGHVFTSEFGKLGGQAVSILVLNIQTHSLILPIYHTGV